MPDWRKTFDDALTATDDELKEAGFRGLEFLLDDTQPPAPLLQDVTGILHVACTHCAMPVHVPIVRYEQASRSAFRCPYCETQQFMPPPAPEAGSCDPGPQTQTETG